MTYGTVEEHSSHGAVDTAAEAQDHLVATHLGLQFGHSGLNETLGSPRLLAAADVNNEVAQQCDTVGRVVHLGVELYRIGLLALNLITCILHVGSAANGLVALGQHLDGVAVAHPHLTAERHILHQRIVLVDIIEVGTAILAYLALLHTTAAPLSQILCAVTHGQQRQLALDAIHLGHRRVSSITAVGATGKDNTLHIGREGRNLIEGVDFAVNIKLADFARNKLSVLTTKV